MGPLRIVADNNIPGIAEAARTLAAQVEIAVVFSAEITAALVRDADLLFVRSTVRCGPALLEQSRVRLVATATIGTDHLDLPWLHARGIATASAPGCNADSVVQWMAAALLHAAERLGLRQTLLGPGLRVGVVGLGNVGGRVARLLEALGAEVLRCDSPRMRAGGDPVVYHDLDDILCAPCDVLTLHVPLTAEGPDRTVSLFDERRLARMPRHAILINASRGEVVDGPALLDALTGGRLRAALLDVFPGEPSPDPALVAAALLATPHIAGHSLEGKVNGTRLVYEAACKHLGVPPTWAPDAALLPRNPLDGTHLRLAGSKYDGDGDDILRELVRESYDITVDDAALRRIAILPALERGAAFRRYRETYPIRRQLTGARFTADGDSSRLRRILATMGAVLAG